MSGYCRQSLSHVVKFQDTPERKYRKCQASQEIPDKVSAMQTTAETITTNVRVELARRNLTQTQLADLIGRPKAWVSRRMTGDTNFAVEDLASIATALNVPVASLLPDEVTQ